MIFSASLILGIPYEWLQVKTNPTAHKSNSSNPKPANFVIYITFYANFTQHFSAKMDLKGDP